MYYLHDNETGRRATLETKDKVLANELLVAKNESAREPTLNLQKARVYILGSDPDAATRTWEDALGGLIASKPADSENRAHLVRFSKERVLKPLLDVALLETWAEQVLNVLCDGGVSTNTFLRRVQNFCVGMNWLPCPVLPAKLWPPVKYKGKRATKYEEHQRIVAWEHNPERRAFYEL